MTANTLAWGLANITIIGATLMVPNGGTRLKESHNMTKLWSQTTTLEQAQFYLKTTYCPVCAHIFAKILQKHFFDKN